MSANSLLPWYEEEQVDKIEIRNAQGRRIERFPGYDTVEDIRRKLRDLGHIGEFTVVAIGHDGRPLEDQGVIDVKASRSRVSNLFTGSSHTRAPKPSTGLDQHALLEHEQNRQAQAEASRREHEERLEENRRRLDEERARTMELRERSVREIAEHKEKTAETAIEAERRAAEATRKAQEAAYQIAIRATEEAAKAKESAAAQVAANAATLSEQQLRVMQKNTEEQLRQIGTMFSQSALQVNEGAARNESMLVTAFSGQVQQAAAEVAVWRDRCDRIEREAARRERDLEEKFAAKEAALRAEVATKELAMRTEANAIVERERVLLTDKERGLQDRAERDRRDAAQREETHRNETERLLDRVENMRAENERLRQELTRQQIEMLTRVNRDGQPSKRLTELRETVEIARAAGVDPAKVMRTELGLVDEEEEKEEKPTMIDSLLGALMSGALTGNRQTASVAPDTRNVQVLTTEPI